MRFAVIVSILVFFVLLFANYTKLLKLPFINIPDKNSAENKFFPIYMFPKVAENFRKAPEITASSAVIIDAKSGIKLFEKEPTLRLLPASTTKLMTALVALEYCTPKKIVKITNPVTDGTQMGLKDGDQVTVENLLYGMLVSSGNDAAYALANACAVSFNNFIASMNQKAHSLSMTESHFVNPAGFDSRLQYSTASDLAILARAAVTNPLISKIVSTKSLVVNDISGIKTYYLENINQLLGEVEGLEGVKTGQTEGSGEILISQTTRNSHTIVVVVLRSKDRFEESQELINWAFDNYKWVTI